MKKAIATIVISLLSLGLIISLSLSQTLTESEGAKTGDISGKVLSTEKEPIKDFFITLFYKEPGTDRKWRVEFADTDKTGYYEFKGLKPGIYLVHIDAFPFADEIYPPQSIDDVVVKPGKCTEDINIYIPLKPSTCITGKVIKKESSEPIKSAKLVAYRKENNKWERITITFSNAEGDYKIKGIDGGEYRIRARADGYSQEIKDNIKIKINAKMDGVNFALSLADGEIKGKVTDIEGVGVPGIDIELNSRDWNYTYATKTDLNGEYLLKDIADNSYYMFVSKDGIPKAMPLEDVKIDGVGIKEINFEIK